MIQEEKLIEQLNNLKSISPSDAFASRLKGVILSTQKPQRNVFGINRLSISLKESLGFTLSVGLVAILVALFLGITPQTVSPIIGSATPGADSVSMLNQANAAVSDIDIHLAEVDTFDAAAQQTSNALTNINPSSMSQERNNIGASSTSVSDDASKIDDVLSKLSN
jgi:hypothetical protein